MKNFYIRILFPSILAILLFILTIFMIIIPRYKESIMQGKREMIKELTNSALSILSKYAADEQNGILTREEAQKTATSRIHYLRYGEEMKDYFWITDMHPNMVMHPYRPDLNGKDLSNFCDPLGKRLFLEFVNTVKESESGYVDYMWQWKDDSLHIVPKLSYVKVFKPWGWIVGTGIYVEDVRKEISALTRNLIVISVCITILIALLLFFISRQSLKIDLKRKLAEDELHESKEKYRALVEASHEGLILIIDGKISYINSTISKFTGFDFEEMVGRPILDFVGVNPDSDNEMLLSGKTIAEGQYELALKCKTGGFIEVLATSTPGEIGNKTINIFILKDLSAERESSLSVLDYQKLLTTLSIGFFRANIENKGRFIFANEVALKILGCENFNQLSNKHILQFLYSSEDRKYLRKQLIENGYIKNKVVKIFRQNREICYVSTTLVLFSNPESKALICDGVIEDITQKILESEEINKLISSLKYSSYLIEQPVIGFVSPAFFIDSNSTIEQVLKAIALRKTDSMLLTSNKNDVIGIVTNHDIQHRVLSYKLKLDNPAYLIMSSPVVYTSGNCNVLEAINTCNSNMIRHLVVKNDSDSILGVVKLNDLYKRAVESLSFFSKSIEKAGSVEEIKKGYGNLKVFLKPLIKSEVSAKYITDIFSSFSDSATKRLIELAIEEYGLPPIAFSFICLGSEGRREETLYTDQDNAIIYEDVPLEQQLFVNEYFLKMGEFVCNALNEIGYSFCKGNIMAKNKQWCKSIGEWKACFRDWIISPEPQNLLDAIIFFDLRNIYGDHRFIASLQSTISDFFIGNSRFFYHLAEGVAQSKIQAVTTSGIRSEKHSQAVELKHSTNQIVMFARTYALKNGIWHTNTVDRINALKQKNILGADIADELLYAYNHLMQLRFKNQLYLTETNIALSNSLNIKILSQIELQVLKDVLAIIPLYQKMISSDFGVTG